ncbi:MAG: RelA/SpoT domain-containing protein [Beijerinckiaceae bacterium]|nr:RelA/SpoT domain-containing protein [Beijerinckiaceae bacterium]
MGWPAPAHSKNAVRKAGQRIRNGAHEVEDIDVLNSWRAAHGYIINTFQANLRSRTQSQNVPVAQRLKRGTTIVDKLRQGRALDLATMQDIAGVRLVFPDTATLNAFRDNFHQSRAKHVLSHERQRYNYIAAPKSSGYRGVHDVFRYKTRSVNGAKWNGLLIEVQYRTLVQHAWATAVELSDALTANRTKFSQGSADNERFFKICSELLARKYESNVSCLAAEAKPALVDEWHDIESRTHIFQRLKDAGVQQGEGDIRGFVLLVVQDSGNLEIRRQGSYREALAKLLEVEGQHPDWDVVLVSGENESLRSAFRNYFRNAKEFVSLMTDALV